MDILTDTKMPDRCTNTLLKDQDIWDGQMPSSPNDIWETYICAGCMGDIQTFGGV